MKYLLIISLVSLSTICRSQVKPANENPLPLKIRYYLSPDDNDPRYAFLNFDKQRDKYLFNESYTPSSLSAGEIANIENLITKSVYEYNATTRGKRIEQSNKYYKQFITVANPNGEKEAWVSCSCRIIGDSWKQTPQRVMDGGTCYFQLKVNLAQNLVSGFKVNGVR